MLIKEILILARDEMARRNKSYVDVAWFPKENPDEKLETIMALRQLELEGKIRVKDRAPHNIISCFVLT
ncbi:hypothetical protein [Escherichia fergusonii]|uniref:hypothetical protein n=1 Tax=Escherichia fergusonii TaxID=564 RepID=UPI00200FEA20|nr:hypothetical protein [Escherichia fergusonii]MEC9927554.1 hypothetical protein [Escherichia marmotae]MEC9975532.1 hypothetical protein [Escherichia marmotae]MED8692124.1 hypothetical protein [Escherichia marmotae]MED8819567.1 hypothetical protein [Escherichia marmotae]MED9685304.1 hypothetical protein [Escherichia marmotae]